MDYYKLIIKSLEQKNVSLVIYDFLFTETDKKIIIIPYKESFKYINKIKKVIKKGYSFNCLKGIEKIISYPLSKVNYSNFSILKKFLKRNKDYSLSFKNNNLFLNSKGIDINKTLKMEI